MARALLTQGPGKAVAIAGHEAIILDVRSRACSLTKNLLRFGLVVAQGVMVTTLLITVVAHSLWRWPAVLVFPVAALFFLLDLTFVSANGHKIPAGGWFPLLVGFIALTLMLVWRKGRRVAFEQREENAVGLETFIASLNQPGAPERMKGTAVYLTKETDIVPSALALNVEAQLDRAQACRSLEGHD